MLHRKTKNLSEELELKSAHKILEKYGYTVVEESNKVDESEGFVDIDVEDIVLQDQLEELKNEIAELRESLVNGISEYLDENMMPKSANVSESKITEDFIVEKISDYLEEYVVTKEEYEDLVTKVSNYMEENVVSKTEKEEMIEGIDAYFREEILPKLEKCSKSKKEMDDDGEDNGDEEDEVKNVDSRSKKESLSNLITKKVNSNKIDESASNVNDKKKFLKRII
jgi:uncharacterized protein (DUF2164 family)